MRHAPWPGHGDRQLDDPSRSGEGKNVVMQGEERQDDPDRSSTESLAGSHCIYPVPGCASCV